MHVKQRVTDHFDHRLSESRMCCRESEIKLMSVRAVRHDNVHVAYLWFAEDPFKDEDGHDREKDDRHHTGNNVDLLDSANFDLVHFTEHVTTVRVWVICPTTRVWLWKEKWMTTVQMNWSLRAFLSSIDTWIRVGGWFTFQSKSFLHFSRFFCNTFHTRFRLPRDTRVVKWRLSSLTWGCKHRRRLHGRWCTGRTNTSHHCIFLNVKERSHSSVRLLTLYCKVVFLSWVTTVNFFSHIQIFPQSLAAWQRLHIHTTTQEETKGNLSHAATTQSISNDFCCRSLLLVSLWILYLYSIFKVNIWCEWKMCSSYRTILNDYECI